MCGRIYEEPDFSVTLFTLEDVITVSTPSGTDEETGVVIGTGGGEISAPFSDFFP